MKVVTALMILAIGCGEDEDPFKPNATTSLSWDDGSCELTNGPGGDTEPGGMIAACFTNGVHPNLIQTARFFVADIGSPTTEFGVRLFREGADGPGEEIPISTTTGQATAGNTWVDVEITDLPTLDSGNLCVAMEWLTPFGASAGSPDAQALCSDNDDPDHYRSWIRWASDDAWHEFQDIGVREPTDVMIRAIVGFESAGIPP